MKKTLTTAICLLMTSSALATDLNYLPYYAPYEISNPGSSVYENRLMSDSYHQSPQFMAEQNRLRKMVQQKAQEEQLKSATEAEETMEQQHARAAMNREAIRLTGKSAVKPKVATQADVTGSSGQH